MITVVAGFVGDCSLYVSMVDLRSLESLGDEDEVRYTTFIRQSMQMVVFGLLLGLWNKKVHEAGINQAENTISEEFV